MHEDVFLEMFSESNNFIIDLFLADFQLFQNTQMKHFFGGESAFAEVRNSGLQGCSVRKKGQFGKDIFGAFEILEYPFLFKHFPNVSVVQFSSRL